MKTKRTLLMAGGLSATVLSAAVLAQNVDLRPLIVTDVSGAVRILQAMPCGDPVDVTRQLTSGLIEIVPPEDLKARSAAFQLLRLSALFEGFTVQRTCSDVPGRVEFSEIGVRLAGTVLFTADSRGGFTIPKEQFLIYESIIENGVAQTRYQRPGEDVTGEIDLAAGTVHLHVVLATRLRFRAGCTTVGCIIDVDKDGTQTADIFGRNVFPDADGDGVKDPADNCRLSPNPDQTPVATPVLVPPPNLTLHSCLDRLIGTARATDICNALPVRITNDAPRRFALGPNLVTWSANDKVDPIVTAVQTVTLADTTLPTAACAATRLAGRFRVSAADDCDTPTIRLGGFTLANGEVIQIQESAVPGVRLLGTVSPGHVRLFEVGPGEGVITATDAATNVARAVCR